MHTRELDRRSLALLDKLVATMTPADLDLPTPCAGWTLADLLRHQVGENNGFAIAARHGSAPSWEGDGWDLAKALGVPYEPLPEAVHEALEFADRRRVRVRPAPRDPRPLAGVGTS
ncbi:maleylpyruvate isomerase N-terminal domain-containing protein [Amycolatopsis sp. NPDC058986]|uniref:maleylpyruvate isomerase N-terminal domain-containing protein n=1 Tax=unclassified Amycolatopsis TaxID=2618356 RepID=UPI00366EF6EC